MTLAQLITLAIIQGAAELLPVSSSAHVILAEKLMGLDPSAPEMTFILVMLHCGTMFAVLLYFWRRWKKLSLHFLKMAILATAVTGFLGLALKKIIETILARILVLDSASPASPEIEHLFKNLPLMAFSLFSVGVFMLYTDFRSRRIQKDVGADQLSNLTPQTSALIGAIQGLCLPFRGFSRSGATISLALIRGLSRETAEDFSFALAILLTPPVVAREFYRLYRSQIKSAAESVGASTASSLSSMSEFSGLLVPGLIGMVFSFAAGLLALRWLSAWLEQGRWNYFGLYCITFSAVVLSAYTLGV